MTLTFEKDSGGALFKDLVAYYKLDDAVDCYHGWNGTNSGVTFDEAGKRGICGTFVRATPTYISLPSNCRQSGIFSFAAWIKPTVVNAEQYIISEWSGTQRNYIIRLINATADFLVGNGLSSQDSSLVTGNVFAINTWCHIVVTRNGTAHKIYINGSLSSSATGSYSGGATSLTQKLGSPNEPTASDSFGGSIDEVGIWSRELSSTEASELYNLGFGQTIIQSINVLKNYRRSRIPGFISFE